MPVAVSNFITGCEHAWQGFLLPQAVMQWAMGNCDSLLLQGKALRAGQPQPAPQCARRCWCKAAQERV